MTLLNLRALTMYIFFQSPSRTIFEYQSVDFCDLFGTFFAMSDNVLRNSREVIFILFVGSATIIS